MKLYYLGPAGSELGFQLAGMTAISCVDGQEVLTRLTEIKEDKGGIVFVDEGIAEEVLMETEEINRSVGVTVVLLANPANPARLAAKKMNHLMVQAVGSDIFNK